MKNKGSNYYEGHSNLTIFITDNNKCYMIGPEICTVNLKKYF